MSIKMISEMPRTEDSSQEPLPIPFNDDDPRDSSLLQKKHPVNLNTVSLSDSLISELVNVCQ